MNWDKLANTLEFDGCKINDPTYLHEFLFLDQAGTIKSLLQHAMLKPWMVNIVDAKQSIFSFALNEDEEKDAATNFNLIFQMKVDN